MKMYCEKCKTVRVFKMFRFDLMKTGKTELNAPCPYCGTNVKDFIHKFLKHCHTSELKLKTVI